VHKSKYIIYSHAIDPDTPLIFPMWVKHSDMAELLPPSSEVLSAGFVEFGIPGKYGDPECRAYGDSVSLGIKSREIDSALINRALGIEVY
jgi:hypothetical protein